MTTLLCLFVGGCNTSPTQDLFGSFFPSWLVCAFAGASVAAVTRIIVSALDFDDAIPLPMLSWLAFGTAVTLGLWILWIGI
ncbi:YtcA family lipoprotein [Gluconobacter kanchanaburiensis]